MDKLLKMLERGEMPNFAQMMQALNDISDIDWNGVGANGTPLNKRLNKNRVPNYPVLACSEFCDSCD